MAGRQLNPPKAACGGVVGKVEVHVPNAQALKRCGLWPCNAEGTKRVWQTNKLSMHYKLTIMPVVR